MKRMTMVAAMCLWALAVMAAAAARSEAADSRDAAFREMHALATAPMPMADRSVPDISSGAQQETIERTTMPANPAVQPVTFVPKGAALLSDPRDVVVSGNIAYCAAQAGLMIIDITNPAAPTLLSEVPVLGECWSLTLNGNFVYLPADTGGLYTIDVTTPTAPTIVNRSTYLGRPSRTFMDGTYLYVTDNSGHLGVFDITVPSTPAGVNSYAVPGHGGNLGYAMIKVGSYLYCGFGTDVVVINVSAPTAPVWVTSRYTYYSAWAFAQKGNYLYMASLNTPVPIFDVSTPSAPFEATEWSAPYQVQGVEISPSGDLVLSNKDQGMTIFNLSAPLAPVLVGSYPIAHTGAWVSTARCRGAYAFVAEQYGGFRVLDISTPSAISPVGGYETDQVFGVALSGNYAYVADFSMGLIIYDISNLSSPVRIGRYPTTSNAYSVKVSGNYAYLCADLAGIIILDITNPSAPVLVGSYDTPNEALDVEKSGNYLFVADNFAGLLVLDITNPALPTLAATLPMPDRAARVTLSGTRLYIGGRSSGMVIVDVTTPTAPVLKSTYPAGDPRFVVAKDNYAYIPTFTGSSLAIVNVTNPSAPTFVNSIYVADAYTAVIVGDYIFVARASSVSSSGPGIQVFNIVDPPNTVPAGSMSDYYPNATRIAIQGSTLAIANANSVSFATFSLPCCVGTTGNVNMAAGVDLADLSALVSYLTASGYVLTCTTEANVNGTGTVDLADLSALVGYLTASGYVLPNCP
jgi:hypothetical protein